MGETAELAIGSTQRRGVKEDKSHMTRSKMAAHLPTHSLILHRSRIESTTVSAGRIDVGADEEGATHHVLEVLLERENYSSLCSKEGLTSNGVANLCASTLISATVESSDGVSKQSTETRRRQ
eukprot:PDM65160.1 hypothetical protein PRIPAC_53409 [Pristionchus pacificus]